ncbi:MAG: AAA family ATPase [Anaplasmataceae bacterium]|nr:AAA family ATPase [Anaplasmataceae bacterium]
MIGFKSLQKSLESLIEQDTLGQGFIFFGPEGVGKKTFALALAQYLESGVFDEAVGWCTDLKIISPQGKTIGIDEAREVRSYLSQTPLSSSRKMIVVDDAHKLTPQAQNALLKIVEEPPAHSFIILIAHDYELLLPTLFSRLPKIYFAPLAISEVSSWLLEKGVERGRAEQLARRARGAPGLAWRFEFDEDLRFIYDAVHRLLRSSPSEVAATLKTMVVEDKFDVLTFLDALIVIVQEEKKNGRFMTTALTMRREAATFNLNYRLQLEYLFSLI